MRKKGCIVFFLVLFGTLISCKPEVNPCNCAQNLLKEEKSFNKELDEACDVHLEKLNEKEARKWTDSMMNCLSDKK